MPEVNSTSKDASAQPIANRKATATRTRASKRLQNGPTDTSEGAYAIAAPNDDIQSSTTIESPAKPMATRTRSRTRLPNVANGHNTIASGEVLAEVSPALNCHPPHNPPESPVKLRKSKTTGVPPHRPTGKKAMAIDNKQATKVKAAAKVKAKRTPPAKKSTAAIPQARSVVQSPRIATQRPTQREMRAQRRATAKEIGDETESAKSKCEGHAEEAPLGRPITSTDSEDRGHVKVCDTDTNQPEEANLDNRPIPGAGVEENKGIEARGGYPSQKTLKRCHEDDDDSEDDDLRDEEEVERLSVIRHKEYEDVKDVFGHQAREQESVSVLRKSKALCKKRKLVHGVRDGPDENTPVGEAFQAEANLEIASECEAKPQNLKTRKDASITVNALQSDIAPSGDADEILSRLLDAVDDGDLESVGSEEGLELEYPSQRDLSLKVAPAAEDAAHQRPGTPRPQSKATYVPASASPHSPIFLGIQYPTQDTPRRVHIPNIPRRTAVPVDNQVKLPSFTTLEVLPVQPDATATPFYRTRGPRRG